MAKRHASALRVSNPTEMHFVPNREQTKSDNFFSVYVNDAQVQTSTWDLRLKLGEVTDIVEEGAKKTLQVNLLGEIRMSPQFAKRLAVILIEQLRGYEQNFGEIPAPREEMED